MAERSQEAAVSQAVAARGRREPGKASEAKRSCAAESIRVEADQRIAVLIPCFNEKAAIGITVAMPAAALLSAAKLARGEPRDIEDVAWWIKEQALGLGDIRTAIGLLPDGTQRENAQENIVFVELLAPTKRKPA